MMILGAQLYTVRKYTTNLNDFAETLKKVADIGYTTVQVSATCEFEAEWLKDQLKQDGLKCVVTHTSPQKLIFETDKVIEAHKTFGCEYIGIGSMPGGVEAYDKFLSDFLPVAKAIADAGMYFMYHNHAPDMIKNGEGKTYLERMANDFSPERLGFILDTYWIQAAGGDPAEWIRKFSGRVPCVHLKDMNYTSTGIKFAPVGLGNMNFNSILSACEKSFTKYLLVEQDDCYDIDPFECLKISYEYLKSLGLK